MPEYGLLSIKVWMGGEMRGLDVVGGELIDEWEEKNLVLTKAKEIQSHLLGGDASYALTQIGFGTNGTPPALGNTALTGAFIKNLAAPTYPIAGQIQQNFTLASGEANGKAISEFGLLTTGGLLYARKTRPVALNKTSSISITGKWLINF